MGNLIAKRDFTDVRDVVGAYYLLAENRLLSNILLKQLVDSLMPLLRENRLSNELHVAEKLQRMLNDILNRAFEGRKTQDKVNWNAIREYVNKKCMTDDFDTEHYLLEIGEKFGMEREKISSEFLRKY